MRRISKQSSCRRSFRHGVYTAVPTDETMEDRVITFQGWILWFLESMPFQACMGLVIVANAMMIGMETDMPNEFPWKSCETVFLGFFVVELLLKLFSIGPHNFLSASGTDFAWNVFDLCVVGSGIVDMLCELTLGQSGGGMATMFRLVRLLRIMRLFRIVKYLKQLYFIAYGFVVAAQAIVWVSIVMGFILFVSSVVLARTLKDLDLDDNPNLHMVHESFGSVSKSMLTLFELMAQPDLKRLKADELLLQRPWILVFLVLYVIFGSFGMIALLTGVISESIFEKNALRIEEARIETETRNQSLCQSCTALFNELCPDEDGEITRQDVQEILPKLADLFDQLDLEYTEAEFEVMVEVMDTNHNNLIDKTEFIEAVLRQAEGVRPMSMQEMQYDVSWCRNKLSKLLALAEETLAMQTSTSVAIPLSESPWASSAEDPALCTTISKARSARQRRKHSMGEALLQSNPPELSQRSTSNPKTPQTPLPPSGAVKMSDVVSRLDSLNSGVESLRGEVLKVSAAVSERRDDRSQTSGSPFAAAAPSLAPQDVLKNVHKDVLGIMKLQAESLASSTMHREFAMGLQRELLDLRREQSAFFADLQSAMRQDVSAVQGVTQSLKACGDRTVAMHREVGMGLQREMLDLRKEQSVFFGDLQSLLRRDLASLQSTAASLKSRRDWPVSSDSMQAQLPRGDGVTVCRTEPTKLHGVTRSFQLSDRTSPFASDVSPTPTAAGSVCGVDCKLDPCSPGEGSTTAPDGKLNPSPMAQGGRLVEKDKISPRSMVQSNSIDWECQVVDSQAVEGGTWGLDSPPGPSLPTEDINSGSHCKLDPSLMVDLGSDMLESKRTEGLSGEAGQSKDVQVTSENV